MAVVREAALGLGKKIALGAVGGVLAFQVPCLASEVSGCELKRGQRPGAAEAAVRKAVRLERARVERQARSRVDYEPIPSRRIILQ